MPADLRDDEQDSPISGADAVPVKVPLRLGNRVAGLTLTLDRRATGPAASGSPPVEFISEEDV
jgi:hypothetical protein